MGFKLLFYNNTLLFYNQHRTTMVRLITCFLLCTALIACSGVPLRSLPRLMKIPSEIMEANPADIMVALQVDARLTPPAGAVPLLVIKLTPREPGGFEPINKKLPLDLSVASVASLGLAPPAAGRRWLIYKMPTSTQVELQRIHTIVRQAQGNPKSGGSLGIGVEQDSLAVTDPALANMPWQTWLQIKKADGFFEVWSGTAAQLQPLVGSR